MKLEEVNSLGRVFELLDHKCKELEKLLEKKAISYYAAVCDCSPLERTYEILVNGERVPIRYCPFCGAPMTEATLLEIRSLEE